MTLYEELERLVARLESADVPYALCGGLAMAVHGRPRATMDIDLLTPAASLDAIRGVTRGLGFQENPRSMSLARGQIELHRFVKVVGDDVLPLDIILVSPLFADIWTDRQRVPSGFGDIWVLSANALARMKALRGSGQDQDDIRHLTGEGEHAG
jgi:hypothetical protein